MDERRVIVDWIGGVSPTQGFGKVDGLPFYYRTRNGAWYLSVAARPEVDPVAVARGGAPGWVWEGTDAFDGYVQAEIAEALIRDLLTTPRERWPSASGHRPLVWVSTPWAWDAVFGERADAMRALVEGEPEEEDQPPGG